MCLMSVITIGALVTVGAALTPTEELEKETARDGQVLELGQGFHLIQFFDGLKLTTETRWESERSLTLTKKA